MTVSVLVPSLSGGGGERAAIKLAQGLALQGISVELIVVDPSGPLKDLIPPVLPTVFLNKQRMRSGIMPLARYLRSHRPQAIISFLVQGNIAAVIAALLSRTNAKVILVEQNEQSTKPGAGEYVSPFMHQLMKLTYPMATVVVAVSYGAAEAIRQLSGAKNVKVIHNPVVDESVVGLSEQNCEHPWMQGSYPVVLNIGRLSYQKNQSLLLRAFAKVRASIDARLIVLGQGELKTSLEAEAKHLGISEYVNFPGFVQNPYAFLARAAVFVLSSRFEGLPTVLIEALACGCNVVSVDCPSGPAEILANGRFGALIRPDEDELSRAIIAKIADPIPQEVLQKRAAQFDVKSSLSGYTGLLSELGVIQANR